MPRGLMAKVVAMAQKIVRRLLRWYINPIVDQQNAYNSAVTPVLESLVGRLGESENALKELQKLRHAEKEVSELRLQRLERAIRGHKVGAMPTGAKAETTSAAYSAPTLDYFRLELKFRGPQLVRERFTRYLKHFEGCQNVLDIGCGRGEFVDMLLEKGIPARGVDLDRDAVASAQDSGLAVELGDAVSYLRGLPDRSLGGVFAAQLVEHLQPARLAVLLDLCHDKMRENAPIVLETLNPVCLYAMAHWFILDPTHVWPIHSETLRFLLESAGFFKIDFEFLSPVPQCDRLLSFSEQAKLCSNDPEAAALLNRNFDRLNRFLYGHQEYAAIAFRPSDVIEDHS